MIAPVKDSVKSHWVNRAPSAIRPYLQLSRLDRPIGYWLLALPGWIGLAFAGLSVGYVAQDLLWALLILIGAIAMRGAGCTYNDIVDQDLDARVERTALRPLPAGSVTTKQAWLWLFAQCAVGLAVLLCLPTLAQIISLCSIPLVAAYPFMKRITWWPQVWLGLTFNWAVLVAYAIKTDGFYFPIIILYLGLIFWTVAYDTIYACQDIEDDMMIGVKSTARRFGRRVKLLVGLFYFAFAVFATLAVFFEPFGNMSFVELLILDQDQMIYLYPLSIFTTLLPCYVAITIVVAKFNPKNTALCLSLFKLNFWVAACLAIGMLFWMIVMSIIIQLFLV